MDAWRRELFDRHRPLIRGMLYGRAKRTRAVEEDLEGAGLWALWRAAETFEPAGAASFESYARQRIRWAMSDWRRASSAFHVLTTSGEWPESEAIPDDRPGTEPRPGRDLEVRDELLGALRRAGLDAREQRVLVLRRAYGRSLSDLAAHLGLTAPTVHAIEQRALAKLRVAFPDNRVCAPDMSMPKRAAPGRLDVWEYPEPTNG